MNAAENPETSAAAEAAREIELALGARTGDELVRSANEVGSWSLAYLGPGFHVQVRIVHRTRGDRIEGWISPVRPMTVALTTVARDPVVRETAPNLNGRFEFRNPPSGACRLAFVTSESEHAFRTPPFWV